MKSCWAAFLFLAASGCSPAPAPPVAAASPSVDAKFIGTWLATDGQDSNPDIAMKLNGDGTLVVQIHSLVMLSGGSFYMTGLWHESGGKFYQTLQTVKLINMNKYLTSPKYESLLIAKATTSLSIGKETSTPITWSGDNTLLMDEGTGKPVPYNRKMN